MEIYGKVIHALEKRSGVSSRTGNKWVSRDFVLEISGQYIRHFVFTVFGEDRLSQFALKKDEYITVHFDVDAHEFNQRWFNSITAYNIVREGNQQVAPPPQQASAPPMTAPQPTQEDTQAGDDLPF